MLKVLAPQHHSPAMQVRGRSRQVSHVALTRQASEERCSSQRRRLLLRGCASEFADEKQLPLESPPHTPPTLASIPATFGRMHMSPASPSSSSSSTTRSTSPCTSASSHYYDSPPSPPRSLEDQVHVAYALDDIHLAKILLLKLKGIEVTSDDDPRIAAVQPEDFDVCFVPPGGLLDAESEKRVLERQRIEQECLEEKQREERLQECGRVWEREKRRLRTEREKELRRRQEKEAEQLEQREAQPLPARVSARHRSVVSFEHLTLNPVYASIATSRSAPDVTSSPFLYNFMPTAPVPPRPRPSRQHPYRPTLSSSQAAAIFDDSRSISFRDVLASMDGPLFPADPEFVNPRCTRQQVALLEALLQAVSWQKGERRRLRGKAKASPTEHSSTTPVSTCIDTATASASPSSSRASWLSFGSSSRSSRSSAAPSIYAWLKAPPPTDAPHRRPPPRTRTLVSLEDGPLYTPHVASSPITYAPPCRRSPVTPSTTKYVVKQVSRFVSIAKGFQNAYMNAALFSVTASVDCSFEDRYVGVGVGRGGVGGGMYPNPSQHPQQPRRKLRPAGYRVRCADAALFRTSTPVASNVSEQQDVFGMTPVDIPLRVRYHPASESSPRTVLPNPLPYPLIFKPHPTIARSPFRHLTDAYVTRSDDLNTSYHSRSRSCPYDYAPSTEAISCRVRVISNPAHLRLKALQNVIWSRGVPWEGRERAECSESSMGSGREKLVALAFDGIGRSMLSRDARRVGHVQAWSHSEC